MTCPVCRRVAVLVPLVIVFWLLSVAADSSDPLPSWNEGAAKQTIIDFVERVTKLDSPDFVVAEKRIATFDNDGTLWSEKPTYFQFIFAMDRVKALVGKHPEWKTKQPFRAVLENDVKAFADSGSKGLRELIFATHTGMTVGEFEHIVKDWLAAARHPRFKRPYSDLVFQPMLEVLAYLRANGFKTFIVSGGGIQFLRTWTEPVYGIPPEQVIGSIVKTKFEMRNGRPVLVRLPEFSFFNNKGEKPVGIDRHIGRRPIAAFGNSDGDLQMLQWTASGKGARYMLIVHHTDAEREWAYDRRSKTGHLDQALDEAFKSGWTVVDMKRDWKVIYPFQLQKRNP